MKYAQSYLQKNRGVYDRHTGKTVKSVIWPPTEKEKIIPTTPKFPKGVLKNFKFWVYGPKMGEDVIVIEEAPYRLADTLELISFYEDDLNVLSKNQIHTEEAKMLEKTEVKTKTESSESSNQNESMGNNDEIGEKSENKMKRSEGNAWKHAVPVLRRMKI
ncbi:hypothetical protein Hanom_Chr16g01426361 [Helianthus anomalus]